MNKEIIGIIAGALALGALSCNRKEEYEAIAKSNKKYDKSPDISASVMEKQVEGNSEFAFDLYHRLTQNNNDNLFYSPYSLSVVMAMIYAGAAGETRKQISDVLNFSPDDEEIHAAFNYLSIELASRSESKNNKEAEGFRLNIINDIWGQKDYEYVQDFLDIMSENYNAGINLLDFIDAPEESRIAINNWVSKQTKEHIQDLVPQDTISKLTRLVLTNAIYFKAAWLNRFKESGTRDDIFHLPDGSEVTVPMMRQSEELGYTEGNGYQAVELPYDTEELSMVIILPQEHYFNDFENGLTSEMVNTIIADIEYQEVLLTMPKFAFGSKARLKETLQSMGITDAFIEGKADFSGITAAERLYVKDIIHQANISVDEEGSEAAAASAGVVWAGITLPDAEITVDRPFIFLIRDIETDTILFIGRVMNPVI